MIFLLGFAVLFGVSYYFLSFIDTPTLPQYAQKPQTEEQFTSDAPKDTPLGYFSQTNQSSDSPNISPFPLISPFTPQQLTISLTDVQFTQLANTYKPSDLPVSDIAFSFSDDTIVATTNANSQVVQGTIKVVAIYEDKWFRITKVEVGTYELPADLTAQIDSLVQETMHDVLTRLYLGGLQIESIKGHTIKLSVNPPNR